MNLELEPAPDFTDRVMAAVRREAGAHGPIPFPWRRVAATAAVAVVASTLSLAAVANTPIAGEVSELGRTVSRLPPSQIAAAAAAILVFGALIGITARLAAR